MNFVFVFLLLCNFIKLCALPLAIGQQMLRYRNSAFRALYAAFFYAYFYYISSFFYTNMYTFCRFFVLLGFTIFFCFFFSLHIFFFFIFVFSLLLFFQVLNFLYFFYYWVHITTVSTLNAYHTILLCFCLFLF